VHTSKKLTAADFRYLSKDNGAWRAVGFDDFCPGYHDLDRVAIVAPFLEDGITYNACTVLALTTAFYDAQRSRSGEFFNYPQHFAMVAADGPRVCSRKGDLTGVETPIGSVWGNLDVWPHPAWIATGNSVLEMLKGVYDHQIHRLFWPQSLRPTGEQPTELWQMLTSVVRKLLANRLKSVYYYDSPSSNLAVHGTQPVADLVQNSLDNLPESNGSAPLGPGDEVTVAADDGPFVVEERFCRVDVEQFLDDMALCFVEP